MPDEANFCFHCGENLAKYRAPSGFVREVEGGSGPAQDAEARPAAPGPAPSRRPPEHPGLTSSPTGGRPTGPAKAPAGTGGRPRGESVATAVSDPARNVESLLANARMAADAKRLSQAAVLFQRAASVDPASQEAWYGLGVVCGRMGNHADALAAFNRLIEVAPRLAAGWDARGTALTALGQTGEAVSSFDEAIALDPNMHSARLEKGIALMRLDDTEGAVECFDELLKRDPSNASGWLRRGDALAKKGRKKEALESFDRSLEEDAAKPAGWRRKGELLLQLGHAQDALRCFDHALQLDENDFDAVMRKGDAQRLVGDPSGAVESYERARSLAPDRPEPLVRRGLLYFSMERYPAARDSFAKATEIAPDNQLAAVNLAVAYYRCGEWSQAKETAEAALLRWPGQVEIARVLQASERKIRTPGKPSAGRRAQLASGQHTVEDIFVIYRDGRLMAHQTRRLRAEMDNQLLSGMLTAIQSFIQEAFREGDDGELNQMSFGRSLILIERGKWVSLAVVIRGVPPVGARAELQFAVEKIEENYGPLLSAWTGDSAAVRGVGEVARRLLEVL